MSGLRQVFVQFLVLGLTSFGGPVAHLGYFHERFVQRERWITAEAYADLVGLCQLLPGPSSSQVGMGLGLIRAGWLGGLAAWAACHRGLAAQRRDIHVGRRRRGSGGEEV